MYKKRIIAACVIALLTSVYSQSYKGRWRYSTYQEVVYAHCSVSPSPGYNVKGDIHFRQKLGSPLEMKIALTGFDNKDDEVYHGFHVHEFGDLSGGCGSTGGHFNPRELNHGAPYDGVRHVGDFGNLVEDDFGNINITRKTDRRASLCRKSTSILGRAIVVHAGKDDLGDGGDESSLANGNAGARVACCVVGLSNGNAWPEN